MVTPIYVYFVTYNPTTLSCSFLYTNLKRRQTFDLLIDIMNLLQVISALSQTLNRSCLRTRIGLVR